MSDIDEYNAIGSKIIGAAFEVRKTAGKGLQERFYEAAFVYELRERGLDVKTQVMIPAIYKGVKVEDSYQADIVVNDKVIIELKAVGYMSETECRQLITYLKLSHFKLGYLINFGANDFCIGHTNERLPYKKGIYRFANTLEDGNLRYPHFRIVNQNQGQ
ncbi:MAG: GxxExxY protein [Muribaculaceae bacterium]|nr:GxxExxY protein [Muribaculaceae bacterium]